ncbi:hypothetical protein CVT25_005839 [Psilocybe cyanescens]|uniref:GLTSCR protein conserved domain-containing protein n=1 Tax=Psilocybe cyanescens TaxID=93625 RepID=A0A409VLV3_PSICY|nr:hypothetical protein CVT25_005839 [Psilocybe cyanescens]
MSSAFSGGYNSPHNQNPANFQFQPTSYFPSNEQLASSSSGTSASTWHQGVQQTTNVIETASTRKPKIIRRPPEELEYMNETVNRFQSRLIQDQANVTHPDVDSPFVDEVDVINRLLPYHMFQQPKDDLETIVSCKGKEKARNLDWMEELHDTKLALKCAQRREAIRDRWRKLRVCSAQRSAPDDQAYYLAQVVLDADRAENAWLGNELRTARNEAERLEREKRANNNMARMSHFSATPQAAVPTLQAQYYRGYPYAYTQAYGSAAPPTISTFSIAPATPPNYAPSQTSAAIPVQLPVASLPALHALGIIPVPAASLPPEGQQQPPAVLRGSTANGTILSLEINVSLLQSTQMSGLAMVLNSLVTRNNTAGSTAHNGSPTTATSNQVASSNSTPNVKPNTTYACHICTPWMETHQNQLPSYVASPPTSPPEVGNLSPTPSSKRPIAFFIHMTEQDSPVDMADELRWAPIRKGSSATVPLRANSIPTPHTETSLPTEHTHLEAPAVTRSYGTLPTRRRVLSKASRRNLSQLPILPNLQRARTSSFSNLPFSSSPFRDLSFARLSTRPISSYDEPLHTKDGVAPDADAKVNGIRVWYSSFTSIDWLHDAIKDSARFSKLRRRQSIRSRLRLIFDKSLGWIIVTIVGFLTAVVAFFVVRSEQLLFDLKEGYCVTGWWKAARFCCPTLDNEETPLLGASCPAWRTWSNVMSPTQGAGTDNLVEYFSYTCIALLLASTSCLLTIYLTNSTTFVTRKESGISFVIHGYLGGRTLFTKAVGLALSVASGLSLGKEGPFVHIASCVGNIVSRITTKYENNEAKRREILSAACAAGVAVAFGAPIGGTLFSLEEVSYFFPPKVMWRSFFCAMIAAITLKILDPFGTGKIVLFQVTYDKDWHAWELLPFVLLGVFGGIYGAYFSKLNYHWSKSVRNKTFLGSHPIIEVLLITLVTSILCFLNPYTRMGGTELIYNLFAECRTGSGNTHLGLCIIDPGSVTHVWPVARSILVAMLVKAGLTIVTFGIKLPAGIFIPTLGVGACAGRVMGIAMQWLQIKHPNLSMFRACGGDIDCIVPGLYAMVGAAATLSGVTRTTVSLAVIMFELTDTLTYAVPVMLSVLVAKTVADALEPKGIYDLVIELNQLPYLDSKHEYLWGNLQINDVTYRDAEVIRVDKKNTARSLKAQVTSFTSSGSDDSGFPLVRRDMNDDGYRMVGYIGLNELEHALALVADDREDEVHFHTAYSHPVASSSISSLQDSGQGTASSPLDPFDFTPYMDQAPLTLANNSPMELVHQIFVKLGARYVIITDTDGLYEGVIDKKTWLAFLTDLEEKS